MACIYLPYLVLTQSGAGFQTLLLFLCGLIMAGTMLRSLVPRRDRFNAPGPRLEVSCHPRLFAEIERLATSLAEPLPQDVYLIPDVNAWVAERGGSTALGSRRVMGLGLPLLQILTVSQFRAVLAHEFGHYDSPVDFPAGWLDNSAPSQWVVALRRGVCRAGMTPTAPEGGPVGTRFKRIRRPDFNLRILRT